MPLNGQIAIIDYNKCSPDKCVNGVCAASEACRRKLLVQEKPYDIPMTSPFSCRACGDCARACPFKAILLMPA